MGVEGGVAWVMVKDEEEFKRLVEPLGFLSWWNYHDDTNLPWLNENKQDGCVYSTWETYQSASLKTLKEIIQLFERLHDLDDPYWYDCWWYQCWFDLTFEEIIEDWQTFPDKHKRFTWEIADFLDYNSPPRPNSFGKFSGGCDHPVLKMKSLDWCKAVRETFVWDSYREVETWT